MKNSITNKQLSEFGMVFGFGFPILIGFIIPMIYGHSFRFWTLFIGLVFLFLGKLKPNLLLYPYKIWMNLGQGLGWINSKLILGLVFILVLLPTSIFMKFFKYDPLKIRKNNVRTYKEIVLNKQINLERIF